MPITATIDLLSTSDLLGFAPTIDVEQANGSMKTFKPTAAFMSGATTHSWSCLSITQTPGPVPSRAMLREDYIDAIGPVTLNRYTADREYGRRIRIYDPATTEENANGINDKVIFLGNIMGRHDSGQHDQKIWIAHDDREVLSNIYVRGAIVAQPDGTVVMNRRFTAHFNPQGMWNCTQGVITGLKNIKDANYTPKVSPVFAPYASLGRAYQSPVEGYKTGDLKLGEVIPWTARLALIYLCNLANMPKTIAIDGVVPNEWRSLSESKRLLWDQDSVISLTAIDPANDSETDPEKKLPGFLDRKLPDLEIRGESFNAAIQKILNAVGCHAWYVKPTTFTVGGTVVTTCSEVSFFPIGTNGSTEVTGKELWLQRGGDLLHADSVYDFDVQEDASNVKPNVLVEGGPVRVETALYYNPDNLTLSDVLPAWTQAEEDNFKRIILGTDLDETTFRTYAKVPPVVGDVTTPFADWDDADGKAEGTTYHPFAWASSQEAVALARQYYPTVFIAYRINPEGLYVKQALDGVSGAFADRTKYPQMHYNRPILKEQLGYMLMDLLADEKPANFMLNKFPIRVCLKSNEETEYVDAVPTPNITITGDGTFWIRGIAEELDGDEIKASAWRSIYDGSLFGNYVTKVKAKKLKFNLAMPMDHRVSSYVCDASTDKSLVNSFCTELGGDGKGPILYIDNPDDSFSENHQVRSTPTATKAMSVGSSNISMPLNRYAPPGSERKYAEIHANRRLLFTRKVEKKTSWKLPWIRLDYPLGTWISKIFCSDAYGKQSGTIPDYDYIVNAPIMSVTYDFQAQETNLAGLDGSL